MGLGVGVGVSCGNLEEGPRGSPFVSVGIFHETLIWFNINQIFGMKRSAK